MSGDKYDPNSIDAVLGRIEARQKSNGEKLDAVIAAHTERFEKAEERITEVEKKQWWMTGAGSVAAFIAGKVFGGK